MPFQQLGKRNLRSLRQSENSTPVKLTQSLRFRISMTLGAILAAIFLFATLLAGWNSYLEQVTASKTHFRGVAAILATSVAREFLDNNRAAVLQSLTAIRGIQEISYVTIADNQGNRFAEIGSGSYLVSEEQEIEDLSPTELLVLNRIWVHSEIIQAGMKIGDIYLLADLSGVRTNVLKAVLINALIAIFAALVAMLIAFRSVARILAPLTRLSLLMRDMGRDGKYDQRAEIDRKGEIAALAHSFNAMATQIQRRDAQLIDYQANLEDMVQTRTEELQIAKDEAEFANQAKSDFLATVSHEIRTPMNGIMIMAELMAEASTTGRQRRYANVIRQSGAGMLAIINDILDLSKIEAGKMDLNLAEIEPDDVIVGIASLLWESANSRSVDLSCYISSRVPEKIMADPIRLSQIITNLVGNGIKFTSDGSVAIEVDTVKSIDKNWTRLRIEVIDTGVGISAERIDSIFDRFEQADTSTVRDYGGTGLGLSICKKLVDAMSGSIGVESKPGKGSTFWFEIEVESSPTHLEHANGPAGSTNHDQKHLALVCRPTATRLALARGLEELGHMVASLDEVSMATAASGGFDAILCEPADALKLRRLSHQTPVVVLTTMNDNEQELREAMPDSEMLFMPCGRRQLRELDLEKNPDHKAEPTPKNIDNNSRFTGLTVLGVDDNLVNRTVLRDALTQLGVNVDLASSGPEALEAVGRKRYDLVFMDCSMPDMDGFEATSAIRASEEKTAATALPIIALTAHLSGPEAEQWRDAGMNDCLTKPFTMESLSLALSKIAAGGDMSDGKSATNEDQEEPHVKNTDGTDDLIDPKTLELLSSLGNKSGSSAASRIFGLYVGTAGPALRNISAMIKEGSAQKLARTVHNFKSMSLSSGACAVAEIAQKMETHAKNGETRRAGELLSELEAVYIRTRNIMNEMIRHQESEPSPQSVNEAVT